MKKYVIVVIFLISGLFFISCNNKELNPSKKQKLYGVSYGTHHRNKLDIVLPKNRNSSTPVVIFIHGGAWIAGNRSVFSTETNMLADAGIACATMNYRYASDYENVHHPDLPEDIKLAVDFIASMADEWGISATRFGLVGHSAGGHLAMITAYTLNDGKIKACASWAGPVDFLDEEQLAINLAPDMFKIYMGFNLVTAHDSLMYMQASPYHTVCEHSVPTLLIYATEDTGVPYGTGEKMQQRLQQFNVPHQFIIQQGAGHIWTGQYLETARDETLKWFKENLTD